MAPRYALGYVREFIRLLEPNGLLVFQMTGRPKAVVKKVAYSLLPERMIRCLAMVKYGTAHPTQVHGIRRDEMIAFLAGMGARILDITDETGRKGGWESFRYFVSKS